MDKAESPPKSRFRDRKTRKLTRRYQESLEDGEYSSSITFSSPRARKRIDADDAEREESFDDDSNRNVGPSARGEVDEDDAEVEEPVDDDGNSNVGEGGRADAANDDLPDGVDSILPSVESSPIYLPELPELEFYAGVDPDRVYPFTTKNGKRKRGFASTEFSDELDYFDPNDADFLQPVKAPQEDYNGNKPCYSSEYYDDAYPCIFPHEPTPTPTSAPGGQYCFGTGQMVAEQDSSRSSEIGRPEKEFGMGFTSQMVRSTPIQQHFTPSPPSRTLRGYQSFEDDPSTNFTHVNRMSLGSLGAGGMDITLTDQPLSLQNFTPYLFDLDRSWKDATKDVQLPYLATNGKTYDEKIEEAWNKLEAHYHHMRPLLVGGGNPVWEQWRRGGDPAWDLSCMRDEQVHDPVPFIDPFEEILEYRNDYAEDLYSPPITPYKSFDIDDWSHPYSDEEASERRKMRLRGGALPEPHGEMGLDASDLAAVEGFVNDNRRGESIEIVEPPTNGDQAKQPGTKKPNSGSATQQPVEESTPSTQSQQGEQRIGDGEGEFVDISRHIDIGEGNGCWCVEMPDLAGFPNY